MSAGPWLREKRQGDEMSDVSCVFFCFCFFFNSLGSEGGDKIKYNINEGQRFPRFLPA